MPAYDYRCQNCGHRFEAWQKITDDPIQVCPKCSGHVQRIIHATGIVFKGGGFYSTDHRSSTSTTAVAEESHAPAAESGASAAKGETKTEAAAPKADVKPSAVSSTAANA